MLGAAADVDTLGVTGGSDEKPSPWTVYF